MSVFIPTLQHRPRASFKVVSQGHAMRTELASRFVRVSAALGHTMRKAIASQLELLLMTPNVCSVDLKPQEPQPRPAAFARLDIAECASIETVRDLVLLPLTLVVPTKRTPTLIHNLAFVTT